MRSSDIIAYIIGGFTNTDLKETKEILKNLENVDDNVLKQIEEHGELAPKVAEGFGEILRKRDLEAARNYTRALSGYKGFCGLVEGICDAFVKWPEDRPLKSRRIAETLEEKLVIDVLKTVERKYDEQVGYRVGFSLPSIVAWSPEAAKEVIKTVKEYAEFGWDGVDSLVETIRFFLFTPVLFTNRYFNDFFYRYEDLKPENVIEAARILRKKEIIEIITKEYRKRVESDIIYGHNTILHLPTIVGIALGLPGAVESTVKYLKEFKFENVDDVGISLLYIAYRLKDPTVVEECLKTLRAYNKKHGSKTVGKILDALTGITYFTKKAETVKEVAKFLRSYIESKEIAKEIVHSFVLVSRLHPRSEDIQNLVSILNSKNSEILLSVAGSIKYMKNPRVFREVIKIFKTYKDNGLEDIIPYLRLPICEIPGEILREEEVLDALPQLRSKKVIAYLKELMKDEKRKDSVYSFIMDIIPVLKAADYVIELVNEYGDKIMKMLSGLEIRDVWSLEGGQLKKILEYLLKSEMGFLNIAMELRKDYYALDAFEALVKSIRKRGTELRAKELENIKKSEELKAREILRALSGRVFLRK